MRGAGTHLAWRSAGAANRSESIWGIKFHRGSIGPRFVANKVAETVKTTVAVPIRVPISIRRKKHYDRSARRKMRVQRHQGVLFRGGSSSTSVWSEECNCRGIKDQMRIYAMKSKLRDWSTARGQDYYGNNPFRCHITSQLNNSSDRRHRSRLSPCMCIT